MNESLRKQSSTIFLRLSILAIGLAVLFICGLLLPEVRHIQKEFPDVPFAIMSIFATIYITAVPYFYGLYKAWDILGLIDRGKAFTFAVARKLRVIYRCAALIGVLYLVNLPAFYVWADATDAPGLMVIGLVLAAVPLVVSVAIAVLQRLLHEAITIKTEHDLTV